MRDTSIRKKNGQFERTIPVWTPDNWSAGYTDNKGRFRVYRPDYPRSYEDGYALRAHVVWWLAVGHPHPRDTELHHLDHDRSNDNFSNLVVLHNRDHQIHHKGNGKHLICERCGVEFYRAAWRLNQGHAGRFCSRKCYRN